MNTQDIGMVHPMAAAATEARLEGRAGYKRAEKLAHQIWADVTGQKLPDQITFRDSEGRLWLLQAHVELRLIEGGNEDAGS